MIRSFLLVLSALVAAACSGNLDPAHRVRTQSWDPAVVAAFSRIPVQDAGRVKPLSTVAQFALLSMNGNRELRVAWSDERKESLSAAEWLLDCFFFPEQAKHYRCLRVDNDEVIAALGLRFDDRKRLDRYSYAEIVPAADKLMSLARKYSRIEAKMRSPVEGQIVTLAEGMQVLDGMLAALEFARHPVEIQRTDGLRAAFAGSAQRPVSFVLQNASSLATMVQMVGSDDVHLDDTKRDQERTALRGILDDLQRATAGAGGLAWFAPLDAQEKTWKTLFDLVGDAFSGAKPAPEHVAMIERFEAMVAKRDDPAAVASLMEETATQAAQTATARGEYGTIATEVNLYRGDYFYRSLLAFGAAFVLVALSWLRPAARLLGFGVHAATITGLVLLVIGITMRCIILGRPPVLNLYDTILFITAVGVTFAYAMEWLSRRRVAISLATFLGMTGLFLARRFEELEGSDTLRQLQAVLDTNFWLSTHVTTVTMGYSAGLLAAMLAHVYILGRLLGGSADFLRSVGRMIYGTVCFGLVFSVVGTILGGIWANYSWGRFWGWDPKENGALLICLAEIAILHGRMAGWLRHYGMALASLGLGVVVAFSWWHVNQLGVGLHAYGFTEGILTALNWFYVSQAGMFVLGLVAGTRQPPPAVAVEAAVGGAVPAPGHG
ncbi:MAG: cytochrome c biogenesis protein CcsA [Planctomycetota bacterium]